MQDELEINYTRDDILGEKWDTDSIVQTREELMGYLAHEIIVKKDPSIKA
jgi:hypothetical protein